MRRPLSLLPARIPLQLGLLVPPLGDRVHHILRSHGARVHRFQILSYIHPLTVDIVYRGLHDICLFQGINKCLILLRIFRIYLRPAECVQLRLPGQALLKIFRPCQKFKELLCLFRVLALFIDKLNHYRLKPVGSVCC